MTEIRFPLAKDTVGKDDIERLCEWMQQSITPKFTMGEVTKRFEEKAAKWVGRKYSVFVNSGSSANLLAVFALKYSNKLKNNIAVVPDVGWVTSIAPFLLSGFETIMCKTSPVDFGIDLEDLERICKEHNPSVLLFVQPLGALVDKKKLLAIKLKYGLTIIEDACGAVGSVYTDGTKAGAIGEMSCWSMFYGHQICSLAEGGLVFTDDKDLYNILVSFRSHGWLRNNDEDVREGMFEIHNVDKFNQPFFFVYPGFNLRNTDVAAFVALRQIDKLTNFAQIRDRNHRRYLENLKDLFQFQSIENNSIVSSISFAMLANSPEQRKKIVTKLNERGIENRLYSSGALKNHPFWFERFDCEGMDEFGHELIIDEVGDKIHDCGFFVPNNQAMTLEDVDFICDVIKEAIE